MTAWVPLHFLPTSGPTLANTLESVIFATSHNCYKFTTSGKSIIYVCLLPSHSPPITQYCAAFLLPSLLTTFVSLAASKSHSLCNAPLTVLATAHVKCRPLVDWECVCLIINCAVPLTDYIWIQLTSILQFTSGFNLHPIFLLTPKFKLHLLRYVIYLYPISTYPHIHLRTYLHPISIYI